MGGRCIDLPSRSEFWYILFEWVMASTSVHLPEDLVARLDEIAQEIGRSRNRVIIEACEAYLAGAREHWPAGFFSSDRLARPDEKALQDSLEEWLETIQSSRRNRAVAPF